MRSERRWGKARSYLTLAAIFESDALGRAWAGLPMNGFDASAGLNTLSYAFPFRHSLGLPSLSASHILCEAWPLT
jgi:hypothetical protein